MTLIWPKALNLTIKYNDHEGYYQTLEQWLDDNSVNPFFDWVSEEEKELAIKNNSIWTIHWYPNTPVGFYALAASTFEVALAAAVELQDD